MQISKFPIATEIAPSDVLLMDGPDGTRSILAAFFEGGGMEITTLDELYNLFDDIGISYQMRRNIFRGKNLGSEFTAEQKAHIADGSFKGFFIGDYWETSDNRYRIADINYWLHTGDTECTTNHLVIVPDKGVGSPQKMNNTNVTTGGYQGSKLIADAIFATIRTIISEIFGTNILSHRELLTNAVSNGYPSGGGWFGSSFDLLNEPMVYGAYMYTAVSNGSNISYRFTIDKTQLSLFKLHPEFIMLINEGEGETRDNYWLRDVVNAAQFAYMRYAGNANTYNASGTFSVRPVFGIIGS